jgi:hypothetical protein
MISLPSLAGRRVGDEGTSEYYALTLTLSQRERAKRKNHWLSERAIIVMLTPREQELLD